MVEGSQVRASVVIPAFGRPVPLRLLLDSLLGLRLESGKVEVIVSDDGSGEVVSAVVREYASRFERLVGVTGPNGGPGVARNRGVAAAAGRVIAFVDSDCTVEPDWLEHLVSTVESGSPLAHGPVRSTVAPVEPFIHSFMIEDRPVSAANLAIAAEVFDSLGGFDERVSRVAEEHELVYRARLAGFEPRFVPRAVVRHPPRLKNLRIPGTGRDQIRLQYQCLRNFYNLVPSYRANCVAANKKLLAKGSVKLLGTAAPFVLAPFFPPVWPLGLAVALGVSLRKRAAANRALEAAGEPIRVPLRSGIKYGLLLPVVDLLLLAEKAWHGLGMLRDEGRPLR